VAEEAPVDSESRDDDGDGGKLVAHGLYLGLIVAYYSLIFHISPQE